MFSPPYWNEFTILQDGQESQIAEIKKLQVDS